MIGTDLHTAANYLRQGEVVAIPTETVYGLAGNALDPVAVSKIFEVKNRPRFDPLIVHCAGAAQFARYARELPDAVQLLSQKYIPGPLTFLLPKSALVPDIVTAGSQRVALRVPNHPLARKLLHALPFPLAAPSANPFGYISPTTAQHVDDQLGGRLPYILDGGPCSIGVESTILGFEDGMPVVYRKGGLAIEEIEAVIGKVEVRAHSSSNPNAPGMLKSHYAPRARLILGKLEELLRAYEGEQVGIISFQRSYDQLAADRQLVLSPTGDFAEAARRLFAGMRQLDQLGLSLILAELLPEEGLGRAINDRLRRAAA